MKNFNFKVNKSIFITLFIIIFLFWQMSTSPTISISEKSNELPVIINEDKNIFKELDTPFMPKMENATLKAELGNAAWKLFHTILARYPDEPTGNQKLHLKTYINSFAQVYPCGDCARHFIKLLGKYPPQLNSRKNAAIWGCFIHNKVNERLDKVIYDCTTILEDYDCGCGADEELPDNTLDGKTFKQVEGIDDTDIHLNSIKIESSENNIGG